jgi:formate--tetrahydrofolate ligase
MATDIEIARAAEARSIMEVGERLGIPPESLIPYGHDKAKVTAAYLAGLKDKSDGKLVLVTAINPTPAGEGKTTTSVGLHDALCRAERRSMLCLREPSLGPCFGMKGGAAGGGHAQVIPMEDINLHFTGDLHAITAANNLLSALLDNHIQWGNALNIDTRRVTWRRVMDMNDRNLRQITTGLGGPGNGVPAQSGFDITVASEVMAILCLATDLADLETRLGRIIVGYRRDKSIVTAQDLEATGAMTVLLKDALQPNLVQTLENNPVLIHGGPFANIAHGCNSVIATKAALKLGDIVVTEAGFGADLGAEKFFDIKCRQAGLSPDAVVLVATVKALKFNGGVAKGDLEPEDVGALGDGLVNLGRHIENIRQYGVPVIVAINQFDSDTAAEHTAIEDFCAARDVEVSLCSHWADGGAGADDLADKVWKVAQDDAVDFAPLYPDKMPLFEKIETIAKKIYHAAGVDASTAVISQLKAYEKQGFGGLPVCIAKTQYSFSTDPSQLGAPSGHRVALREVRLSAGAGFVVAICGDILTMPGLPRVPSANTIGLNDAGETVGLF